MDKTEHANINLIKGETMCHHGHHQKQCNCGTEQHHRHHGEECCCGGGKGNWRKFMTKEEKRERLENYAKELEAELTAVKELLKEL